MNDMPNTKYVILTVDDTPVNLDVLGGILSGEYEIKAAIRGDIALKIAEKQQPDIILLDVMMPGMDGFEVCRRLKANPLTLDIPVIFITAMLGPEDEQKGYDMGAADYISKPVNPSTVRQRVKTHLALSQHERICKKIVAKHRRAVEQTQYDAISILSEVSAYGEPGNKTHLIRVSAYSALLARASNWTDSQVKQLKLAALLHDIGNVAVPDDILNSSKSFADAEKNLIKMHSQAGFNLLSKSKKKIFRLAASIALSHHEHWDGSGYPKAIAGEDIPLPARIVAIADAFDAMTSERRYKPVMSADQAFDVIEQRAGKQFDPQLATLFVAMRGEVVALQQRK